MKNSEEVVSQDLEYICENLKDEFAKLVNKGVLIVGGGGFLGYYLVKAILKWNDINPKSVINLTVLDNFVRGCPLWLKKLESTKNILIKEHDITKPLPKDLPDFSYIIHAASIASPNFYRKFPLETMDANVNGLRILLDYALMQKNTKNPIEGFLFFSTSEIYGDPPNNEIPTSENYRGNVSCTGPRACYDESKRFGETLCVTFAEQYNLPIRIARPFNNYGPGLKISDRRVIPDLAKDIFAGRDVTLLSNGSPTRTFCYITDAIVGYFKILIIGKSGASYNIGTESPEISMLELANALVSISHKLFDYKGTVVYKTSEDKNYLVDNPIRRCPSILKARSELNFNPTISLEDGLTRSLIWYSENLEAIDA
jgi:nucleoside-diphosphate-sugar epimerase